MLNKKRTVALIAACIALGVAVVGGNTDQAEAHKGKTIALQETAVLRLTKNSANVHEAEGPATGTFKGRLHLRIDVETASRMTARFSSTAARGGLTGTGVASYTVSGHILRYSGTTKIVKGSGAYANASGHGIHIEGTLNRLKERMTITISGTMRT